MWPWCLTCFRKSDDEHHARNPQYSLYFTSSRISSNWRWITSNREVGGHIDLVSKGIQTARDSKEMAMFADSPHPLPPFLDSPLSLSHSTPRQDSLSPFGINLTPRTRSRSFALLYAIVYFSPIFLSDSEPCAKFLEFLYFSRFKFDFSE